MAISPRVTSKTELSKSGPASEEAIDALIDKGGSPTRATSQQADEDEPLKAILIKLPQSKADEIDAEVRRVPRHLRTSRVAYIALAIEEKLQRDKNKRK